MKWDVNQKEWHKWRGGKTWEDMRAAVTRPLHKLKACKARSVPSTVETLVKWSRTRITPGLIVRGNQSHTCTTEVMEHLVFYRLNVCVINKCREHESEFFWLGRGIYFVAYVVCIWNWNQTAKINAVMQQTSNCCGKYTYLLTPVIGRCSPRRSLRIYRKTVRAFGLWRQMGSPGVSSKVLCVALEKDTLRVEFPMSRIVSCNKSGVSYIDSRISYVENSFVRQK